jgi:LEA14-like dessication related protein
MKGQNIFLVGGAAALIFWLKSRKNLFTSTKFFFKGVKIDGSLLAPELIVKLNAINDTPHTQDINRIEGQIFLNDTILIGNVLQTTKQVIAANTTSEIQLPINVRLNGIIDTVGQLISRKAGKYSFVGTVNVYGLNVPVNQSYKF